MRLRFKKKLLSFEAMASERDGGILTETGFAGSKVR